MIQQTSLSAYYFIKSDPVSLGEKQRIVYETIRDYGILTDKEISKILNWSINRVTPRRGELVNMGLITKVKVISNPYSRRLETLWGVL